MLIPTLLAVLCGLRRGEICALRWRNVDLAAGQFSVVESLEQTKAGLRFKLPKSGKGGPWSCRQPCWPNSAPIATARPGHAELGEPLSGDDLVVAHADGSVVQPITLAALGPNHPQDAAQRLRFHDLRHAHATHLLAIGTHPKVASERLGHSKVGITLDLYSHVIPGMQKEAAATVDAPWKSDQEPEDKLVAKRLQPHLRTKRDGII